MNELITYPLFGQARERSINGIQSAWLETLEITPFIRCEDGSLKGKIIYCLKDLKADNIEKLKIQEIVIRDGEGLPQPKLSEV